MVRGVPSTSPDGRSDALRKDHGKVIDRLSAIQQREQLSLQEQEKDLLRAFRARLWDVQFELEAERSKKDDGALEWIEKTKTLGKELDWSREEALRLAVCKRARVCNRNRFDVGDELSVGAVALRHRLGQRVGVHAHGVELQLFIEDAARREHGAWMVLEVVDVECEPRLFLNLLRLGKRLKRLFSPVEVRSRLGAGDHAHGRQSA